LRGKLSGLTNIIFFNVALNGVVVCIFAAWQNLWAAALLLSISGFTQACTGTGTQTLIQSSVDDRLRGRVMSVWLVIGRGGPAFGALVMGMAAEVVGFSLPVLIGSLISLTAVIIIFSKRKRIAQDLEQSNNL
jgi:MFS family permease